MNISISPGEEIPNGEILYRYCRPSALPDDQAELPVSIFNDPELSCDWAYYQMSPETSYHVVKEGLSLIIRIDVCDEIKNIENPKRSGQFVAAWHQDVVYDPISVAKDPIHGANVAHSLIRGKKKPAVCEALKAHAQKWLTGEYKKSGC